MMKAVSIIVKGKVQGVFYRRSAKEKALELGVSGSVKNNSDGSVHIKAVGEPDRLDQLASWCKTGPSRAEVTSVDVQEIPPFSSSGFRIE